MAEPSFSPNINFAKVGETKLEETEQLDRKIARFTGIGMVVFVIVSAGVLIFHFTVAGNQERVGNSITAVQQQLSSLSQEEARYLVFVQKVKLLSGIQEDRKARKEALDFLNELVPEEDVLKQVQLDQEKKMVTFSIEMPDVFALSRFLSILAGDDVRKETYRLQTQDLSRSPEGKYILNAQLTFETDSKSVAKGAR